MIIHWFRETEPKLFVNLRRVNDETRIEHRSRLYSEDIVYRARVMRRMREGLTAEQLAPLIDTRLSPKKGKVKVG